MSADAKQAVALSSIAASGFMVLMKLIVGLLTGSLGILSEAAHSALDLGCAFLTWLAVRIGDQPADKQHPYGHAKFESVSALIGTGLLFITAIGIVYEAVERLLSPAPAVEVTWYAVAMVVITMAIDIGRSRALMKVAKATGSQALEADALHFRSDILSSGVVLLGLGFVAFGWVKGDAIAALGVSFFVAHAGWDLGKRTVDVLVDAAPEGIAERLETVISTIPGVARLDMVRARLAGASVFVDAVVRVSRTMPLEQVEAVRVQVAECIRETLGQAEPMVVMEPLALDDESIAETVRVLASAHGLSIHDIGIATIEGRPHVSFDLEVDEELTVAAAHAHATTMENALWRELGDTIAIDIHIDPRRSHMFTGIAASAEQVVQTQSALDQAVAALPLARGAHHLRVQVREDGLYASCHCLFPDNASIRDVHDATERIQHVVLRTVPGMARVVVHAEPASHPDESDVG